MLNQTQSFNDGIVKIYRVVDIALPGDMPKEGLILQLTLRYKERTVGLTRYYAALQNNIKVDFVIRCQQVREVLANDVAILVDENQYRVMQVQYPEDVEPPVMDLTLEKVGEFYDVE